MEIHLDKQPDWRNHFYFLTLKMAIEMENKKTDIPECPWKVCICQES